MFLTQIPFPRRDQTTRTGQEHITFPVIVQQLWLIFCITLVASMLSAACGSRTTAIEAGNTSILSLMSRSGYGSSQGCPSDLVVISRPKPTDVTLLLEQNNETITVKKGQLIEIQLPFGIAWKGLTTSQGHLQLLKPFGYARPASKACIWRFLAWDVGTTKLTFTGRAICHEGSPCPLYIISVPFIIKVS